MLIPDAVAHRLIVAAIWYYLCQMFASPLSAQRPEKLQIKRLSSGCECFLIGAVTGEGEDNDTVLQNVSKLQKAIFKHLRVGLELRVVTMPLDREVRVSMQSRRPLALLEPPASCSAAAIARLCENLLRN